MSHELLTKITCDYCGTFIFTKSERYTAEVLGPLGGFEFEEDRISGGLVRFYQGWVAFTDERVKSQTTVNPVFHACPDCNTIQRHDKQAVRAWEAQKAVAAKGHGWGKLLPCIKHQQVKDWLAANPKPKPILKNMTEYLNGKVRN